MVWCERTIRTLMLSSRDAKIIELWVEKQPSPYTRGCYRRDSERLLNHAKKPLSAITLADLQSFDRDLTRSGLAPISRVRTLAAVKSLFGFCHRMRYLPANPAAELALPSYEHRLAERILPEGDEQSEPAKPLLLLAIRVNGQNATRMAEGGR